MTAAQRDLLWQLIEVYTVEHLPPALAETQRARTRIRRQGGGAFRLVRPATRRKRRSATG